MKKRPKSKTLPLASGTGSQFWIIDSETSGEHEASRTAIGPYPSMAAAEKWLRDDAAESFLDADKSLRSSEEAEPWGAPMHIVEVRKTVRQVPRAKVSVTLQTVNAELCREAPRVEQ